MDNEFDAISPSESKQEWVLNRGDDVNIKLPAVSGVRQRSFQVYIAKEGT